MHPALPFESPDFLSYYHSPEGLEDRRALLKGLWTHLAQYYLKHQKEDTRDYSVENLQQLAHSLHVNPQNYSTAINFITVDLDPGEYFFLLTQYNSGFIYSSVYAGIQANEHPDQPTLTHTDATDRRAQRCLQTAYLLMFMRLFDRKDRTQQQHMHAVLTDYLRSQTPHNPMAKWAHHICPQFMHLSRGLWRDQQHAQWTYYTLGLLSLFTLPLAPMSIWLAGVSIAISTTLMVLLAKTLTGNHMFTASSRSLLGQLYPWLSTHFLGRLSSYLLFPGARPIEESSIDPNKPVAIWKVFLYLLLGKRALIVPSPAQQIEALRILARPKERYLLPLVVPNRFAFIRSTQITHFESSYLAQCEQEALTQTINSTLHSSPTEEGSSPSKSSSTRL